MKNLNGRVKLLAVLLSVTVSACGKIPVKDKEACADLGKYGAECAHTYITKRRSVPKAQWDKERIGWICVRSNDYSDTEDVIDTLCRTTPLCDYQTQEAIQRLKTNMSPVVKKAKTEAKAQRAPITTPIPASIVKAQ